MCVSAVVLYPDYTRVYLVLYSLVSAEGVGVNFGVATSCSRNVRIQLGSSCLSLGWLYYFPGQCREDLYTIYHRRHFAIIYLSIVSSPRAPPPLGRVLHLKIACRSKATRPAIHVIGMRTPDNVYSGIQPRRMYGTVRRLLKNDLVGSLHCFHYVRSLQVLVHVD